MLGNATEKIGRIVDLAEELYERVIELRDQVAELRETSRETRDRVARIEDELARNRALLAAIAEAEEIDVDTIETVPLEGSNEVDESDEVDESSASEPVAGSTEGS